MKKSPFSDRDQREVAAYNPPASPGNCHPQDEGCCKNQSQSRTASNKSGCSIQRIKRRQSWQDYSRVFQEQPSPLGYVYPKRLF